MTSNDTSSYLYPEQQQAIRWVNSFTWDFFLTLSYNSTIYSRSQVYKDIMLVRRFLSKTYKSEVLYFANVVNVESVIHCHALYKMKKPFDFDLKEFNSKKFYLFRNKTKLPLHEYLTGHCKTDKNHTIIIDNDLISHLRTFDLKKIGDQENLLQYFFKMKHWKTSYDKDGRKKLELFDFFVSEKLKKN